MNGLGFFNRSRRSWLLAGVLAMLLQVLSLVARECWAEAAPGEIIVRFKDQVNTEVLAQEAQRLGVSALAMAGMQSVLLKKAGLVSASRLEPLRAELLKIPAGLSEEQAIERIQRSPLVAYCEKNYIYQPTYLTDGPNDPYYQADLQWWLQQTQADKIFADKSLYASLTRSAQEVIIAIVDTGVSLTHEDLVDRLKLPGVDFFHPGGTGSDMGEGDHGTHVAGIAAAAANNGKGIAGIACLPTIKLLPVRVMDKDGGTLYVISQGIVWAVDHQARVINLSLGGTQESRLLQDSVNYAYAQGVVVVAAAGNEALNGNPLYYPASDNHVIAVAALDNNGYRAPYSSFGKYIDLAAPGGYYEATTYNAQALIFSTLPGNLYNCHQGTSMAAPMVSGAAAMVLSQNPHLTPDEVENLMITSADKVGTLPNQPQGWDIFVGWGRVNLYRALTRAMTFNAKPGGRATYNYPNPFHAAQGETTNIVVPLSAGEEPGGVKVRIYDDVGNLVRGWEVPASEIWPGKIIVWNGKNSQGDTVASGVYLYTLEINGKRYTNKIAAIK